MAESNLLALVFMFMIVAPLSKATLCVLSSRDFETNSESFCEVHCSQNIELKDVALLSEQYLEVEIHLCSADYNSSDALRFTNLLGVTIAGNGSRLNCRNEKSGLQFENVSRVHINNVALIQCGCEVNNAEFKNFTIGVYIYNSNNITMNGVLIQRSNGIGLVLFNNGHVNITDSHFDQNYLPNSNIPGVGLIIKGTSSQQSQYCIKGCNFTRNGVSKAKNFTNGGGMIASFEEESNSITVAIVNCRFTENTAKHGGALHISFQNSTQNVSVIVERSRFENNSAQLRGGAVLAGFVVDSNKMAQNTILFSGCYFTGNKAEYGGGTYLYAAPDYYDRNTSEYNNFTFVDCCWTRNRALYGSAVLISPYTSAKFLKKGKLPIPLFQNCSFINNTFKTTLLKNHSNYNVKAYSTGTVYINTFTVLLCGEINFVQNSNTAVYLFASALEITRHSSIRFDRNYGYQGGAIHLEELASIYLNDNTDIVFTNNTAINGGGAVYHSAPAEPTYLINQNCFLKYIGFERDVTKRNITTVFDNNTVFNLTSFDSNSIRQSIFLFSALPCCIIYDSKDIKQVLNKIGNIHFAQQDDTTATFASDFLVNNLPRFLIPGIEKELDIVLIGETNATIIPPTYRVGLKKPNPNSYIAVDPAYTIVTNNKIKLYGRPGSCGEVELVLFSKPSTPLSFNITLQDCPPGYVFEKERMVCLCSANTINELYLGIQRCNQTNNQANLVYGYWAGYYAGTAMENFRTSSCPLGYCSNEHADRSEISLSESTNLNDLVCSKNRSGVLCAECENGTSVSYPTFECAEEKHCSLGILFFVLSQILPVTILFLIVLLFDIQLTTGALNGCLFFMQIFNTLAVSANNFITFPNGTKTLLSILNFIVSIFNLKFFNTSRSSFCLFEGATSLDVIAFGYIIVIYSLILIIFTILILNLRCYRINKFLQRLNRRNFSQSIIHGLSGFLVMCYARTTTTTLQLITPSWLNGKGLYRNETRVFYYGEFEYFEDRHLKYAIPALFALVFMTLLPPILFLAYPLCYRVLALLRIQESKFTKLLCRAIPLEKFKPFFDSFQGAFKDKHRYFAGLYFVYRLTALVTYTYVTNLTDFYFYLEIQLIAMLALHAWIQPYKKKWHNRLDLYIFTLLLVLNSITFYNYQWTFNQLDKSHTVQVFSTIQVVLAYSPIVLITVPLFARLRAKSLVKSLREILKFRKKEEEDLTISLSVYDERRFEDSEANYETI